MTDLVWPLNVVPSSMSINLVSNAVSFNSQFNNSTTTHNFPGARWVASLEFDNLDNFSVNEIDILQTFLWQLEGMNGRFMMWDFSKPGTPEKGTPVVNGSGQYGTILQTDGWLPNTMVIPAARYFSVNGELKFLTKDAVSDSNGNCVLHFVPPLRKSPEDGAKITTNRPKGMFRLGNNDQGVFNLTPGLEATVSIEVVEAFHV